ncbi:unnamed protein product [Adineta steineri]|uniref:NAD(P)(+)--arginine ADP-ribosyltransferase n=1 Tax=Adineta steineri TaxID=433720 RepID=A0A815B6K0_9BILA|nr:unnamed protein product [Adineta steineri]CAF1552052.1 unnamed protein product [Adineta steineri]
MTSENISGPNLIHRVSDITEESSQILTFFEDYENIPLVSLEEAIQPLTTYIPDIERKVWIVKQRCKNPSDNLTSDESASIMLYTMEWDCYTNSLYYILNKILRQENEELLKPWLYYLKLLSYALSCLPSIQQTVYRGVKLDLSYLYSENKNIIWWSFSSCTMTINVLEREEFCGKTGLRTLFTIECLNAKNIRQHSYYEKENEVLLVAGTQFHIIGQYSPSSDIHVIQLKEIQSSILLKNLEKRKFSQTSNDLVSLLNTSYKIITTSMNYIPYTNISLEKHLLTCDDCIFLYRRKLNDHDMKIIVEQAINNKQCHLLDLHYNEITSNGALILSDALCNNKTLWILRVSKNWISDIGAYSLAVVLTISNSTLRTLDLSKNGISNEGLQYLIDMLKINKTLIELSLYDNLFDNHGIKNLTNTLVHYNKSLRWLNLSDNKLINNSSTKYLIYMLKYNRTLEYLSIQNCNFYEKNKVKLRKKAKAKVKCHIEI